MDNNLKTKFALIERLVAISNIIAALAEDIISLTIEEVNTLNKQTIGENSKKVSSQQISKYPPNV